MIYLDQAATSFPKPPAVLAAVQRWFTESGVSADRGSSQRCAAVARTVQEARAGIGALVGLPAARVAFTSGATEAINLFLRALLRPGDRVLTTAFEHSSVARPLTALQRERGIEVRVLPPDRDGGLGPGTVAAALAAERPALFAFTHGSNVTGAVFDAPALCALARAHGARSFVDVSQTIGLLPVACGADAYSGSAHKALLAPPGLGFLAVAEHLSLPPQKQGGTGSSRALDEHPSAWPTAFEAGTPNTPAIVGLAAALRPGVAPSPAERLRGALAHADALTERLRGDPGVRLLLPPTATRLPIVSFVAAAMDPAEIGAMLDAADVHARTGHHCAPWIHRHLGTERAGTVRLSPGHELSADDIRAVSAALGR